MINHNLVLKILFLFSLQKFMSSLWHGICVSNLEYGYRTIIIIVIIARVCLWLPFGATLTLCFVSRPPIGRYLACVVFNMHSANDNTHMHHIWDDETETALTKEAFVSWRQQQNAPNHLGYDVIGICGCYRLFTVRCNHMLAHVSMSWAQFIVQ